MQNSVNHRDFERTWHFQVSLGSMFLRVEFPPHLGGAPPRGGAAGGGLWRAFGCASLAEAGEYGACAPGAGPAIRPGWRSGGVASRWARAVPIGVLVASPRERRRSLMCRSISCRSGLTGDPFCERASASQPHRCLCTPRGGEGRLFYVRPASEPPPSNGARLPAELKHITKRRKRNQQGCP